MQPQLFSTKCLHHCFSSHTVLNLQPASLTSSSVQLPITSSPPKSHLAPSTSVCDSLNQNICPSLQTSPPYISTCSITLKPLNHTLDHLSWDLSFFSLYLVACLPGLTNVMQNCTLQVYTLFTSSSMSLLPHNRFVRLWLKRRHMNRSSWYCRV